MEDAKIFIKGRTSVEEEKDGKLICEQIVSFEEAMQGGELFPKRFGRGGYDGGNSWGYGQQRSSTGNGAQGGGVQQVNNGAGTRATGNEARPQANKLPDGVWIQFASVADFEASERKLYDTIADLEGDDQIVIFIKENKAIKVLPPNRNVCADAILQKRLSEVFGAENIKFRLKPIEKR